MVEPGSAEGEVGDRLFDIDGVTGTQALVVLETFVERPVHVSQETDGSA